jgi:long-chain fatty acid transport protein
MKRWMVWSVLFVCGVSALSAGVVTNSNQSAIYIRMLSRNPSMDIDAVYYNPAGLVKLSDGFHLAIHNQTILQDKKINSQFPFLNDTMYVGKVNVPIFPNAYAVYKKDRMALSFGFGPNGGGGTADFTRGLPSFEIPISLLPVMLTGMGLRTTQYSADIALEGRSIFLGFQGNLSYAVNDTVAVAAGARLIQAKNTYLGHIKNVMINPLFAGNPTAQMISAPGFFAMIGRPDLAAAVSDMSVDAEQTGSAITPIVSVNLTPAEGLNISLKYEFKTALELQNKTAKDDTGMFPDGLIFRNDIPAILSAGAQYAVTPQWRALLSLNYFFDKDADWGGAETLVDNNTYELSLGTEYDISPMLTLSAGYLRTQFGLNEAYQDDIGHELSSDTFGFGGRIRATDRLDIDLGVIFVSYQNITRNWVTQGIPYPETYSRTTTAFSVGLGYRF